MGMNSFCSVACDIGGTFTDFALLDNETGEIAVEKTLTVPSVPSQGVINGVRALVSQKPDYIKHTQKFTHATTLVANAVIERKGAKTALLCTKGFRDTLELRRHRRVKVYDLWLDHPEPLIPRYLRIPVTERTYSDGRILIDVNEEEVREIVAVLRKERIESVAIAFLHSYVNPANEKKVGELLHGLAPEIVFSLSSDVLPELGEYERTSTTVVNAYVKALCQSYLQQLQDDLTAEGFSAKLVVSFSGGGVASVKSATEFPVRLVESGPVAGAVAARIYGQLAGINDILSFDMGGTTAKVCLISEGSLPMTSEFEVARSERFQKGSGYPVAVPTLDLIEIGAGGGSIARISKLGVLEVGPESAGADPGPICYGFGGKDPTVTDANFALGYLNPDYFLGGEMRLDMNASQAGIAERLASPLGRDPLEAAWTVHEVVNENMAAALKMHVVEKGGDPARCAMVAFGGCGPVHAYNLAHRVGIQKLLVPLRAGVMSAVGLLAAPPAFDLTRTHKVPLQKLDPIALERVLKGMEIEITRFLREVDPTGMIEFARWAEMSYIGQGYQIPVRLPQDELSTASSDVMWTLFAQEYRAKYDYFYEDVPVELVKLRVRGEVKGAELKPKRLQMHNEHAGNALKGRRLAYSVVHKELRMQPVYDRYRLAPGIAVDGPAIIEERESTTVIGDGGRVEVDEYGTLIVAVA